MVKDKKELREYLINEGFDAYVFNTLEKSELELQDELNGKFEDLYALVLKRMVHRSDHGRKWDEESVLITRYVFVYVEKGYDIKNIRTDNNPFRILNHKYDNGKLYGDDYTYSKWVLKQDGLIGVSKAVKVNEKVKIVSGPLQELEGYIIDYSKRNRNCLVEINFMNQTVKTWLPFEWLDQNYILDDDNV